MQDREHFSKNEQLLAATALMPLLGAMAENCNLRALNYTLFVALYFLFKKFPRAQVTKSAVMLHLEFFMLYLVSSLVSQALALLSGDHLESFAELTATSSASWLNLLGSSLATGFAMGIGWLTAFRFFKFSLAQAFLLAAALAPVIDSDLLGTVVGFKTSQDLLALISHVFEGCLAGGATLGIALVSLINDFDKQKNLTKCCLLYTSPSPRD